MRDPTEHVEIIDPPISELTKRHRSFARTCFTGCFFIVLFIGAVVGGVKFWLGSGPRRLTAVPPEFPKNIPLYDRDSISEISFISARYKNRSLKLATLFPKIFLAPLLTDETAPSGAPSSATASLGFWQTLTTPVGDGSDVVKIEWRGMPAEPDFVASHYHNELARKQYIVRDEEQGQSAGTGEQFSFTSAPAGSGVYGTFSITDSPSTRGTDYAVLTVHLPAGGAPQR